MSYRRGFHVASATLQHATWKSDRRFKFLCSHEELVCAPVYRRLLRTFAATVASPGSCGEKEKYPSPCQGIPGQQEQIPSQLASAVIFTDGAARGNPGPGGAGVAITDSETTQVLHRYYLYLGDRVTNNVAEYMVSEQFHTNIKHILKGEFLGCIVIGLAMRD
eukprot:gb/GECG01003957.1/.p1 GENE.gb/GECG01003957.1/~~gb/GECG01003957.1/.p1  ORF type:complete len:163 (+),score=11.53 gb/GECG01003957.1/:1-489(+)